VERLEDAVHRFGTLGDPARQAETLLLLIMCASILSDHERAKRYYAAMQAITQQSGEVWFRAYAKWSLGVSSWRVGDLDDATELLQDAFALSRGTNDPVIRELSLEGLAWAAAKHREWVRAARLLGAAESLTPVAGNTMIPAYAEYHAECVRAIQRAVGKRVFATAVAEGRGLSADGVFALALAKARS
jgi:non-specific serine/threonine protein kinase